MRKIFFLFTFILCFYPAHAPTVALTDSEIEKYIWQKQVIKDISPQADPLRIELAQKINQMIEAGHLAPYRYNAGESAIIYLWYHAGEPIYTLSEAYKYLPDADTGTKEALSGYLQQEMSLYPPYTPTAVYDRAPWLPTNVGTRREYYPLDPNESLPEYVNNQTHPVIQGFYHTWAYLDATNDLAAINTNWDAIVAHFDNLKDRTDKGWRDDGGCVSKYGDIAGCIGMARLAYLTNHPDQIAEAVSRALTGFDAGMNFSQFNENSWSQASYFDEVGGDDYRDRNGNRIESYVYLNLFPETARFIRDYAHEASTDHLQNLTDNIPAWFIVNSPAFRGGEMNRIAPIISFPMFQAYAQIERAGAEFLGARLDVPLAKIGDLYYIQNLISTIKAYGQTCWQDIRDSAEICEEAASTP